MSNLLLAGAPLFLWRRMRSIRLLSVAAVAYLFSFFMALYWFRTSDQGVGYYLWTGAFLLMAMGCWKERATLKKRTLPVQSPFSYVPRTPEELAAERELKESLRGESAYRS